MSAGGISDKLEWIGIGIGGDALPSLFLPVGSLEPSYDNKDYSPKEHRGKLNVKYIKRKLFSSVKLALKGDMRPDGILEYLTYLGLGSKVTAQQGGTTAYKHTVTESQTKPKCTLWKGYTTDDETIVPMKFANALLETLDLELKEQGEGSLSASFKADTVDLDTTEQTLVWPSDPVPFVFPDLDFKQADYGTAPALDTSITEFSLNLKNEITEKQTADRSIFPSIRTCTGYEINGKLGQIFENQNLLKEWLGGLTRTSMGPDYVWKNAVVDLTGPLIASTYYYKNTITIPYLVVNDYNDPKGDILEYNYGWEAYEKGTIPGTNDFLMKSEITSKLVAIA